MGGIEPSLTADSLRLLARSITTEHFGRCAPIFLFTDGRVTVERIVEELKAGRSLPELTEVPQTVYLRPSTTVEVSDQDIQLFSHEECLKSKRNQAQNFRHIETESNNTTHTVSYNVGGAETVVVNPPFPPMSEEQIDRSFDLPYTRLPHPRYRGKRIAAYEMIKHSVNATSRLFRWLCFLHDQCAPREVCRPRSEESVIREVEQDCGNGRFQRLSKRCWGLRPTCTKCTDAIKLCVHAVSVSPNNPSICPNLMQIIPH